jgi:hypothetical protein
MPARLPLVIVGIPQHACPDLLDGHSPRPQQVEDLPVVVVRVRPMRLQELRQLRHADAAHALQVAHERVVGER